ncbi:MAG: hypothetical protein Q7S22_04140, partial [Candidatus Micrarchaeota archaeon]|nr:hypothetical protein [Candidatus Micrarchaeota archaeon]
MNLKNNLVYVVVLILVIVGMYYVFSKDNIDMNYPQPQPGFEIPKTAIHWHSWLKIIINGQEQQIPDDIGITIGKKVDFDLGSDMNAAPIHTHSGDGEVVTDIGRKLHMESLKPYVKPRTLTLGY